MRQWPWLVVFLLVSWAGMFGITVAVVEWRTDDGGGQVTTDKHIEWVLCIVGTETESEFLTEPNLQEIIRTCDPAMTRAWVYCISEGFELGAPGIPVTLEEAQIIARSCERELGKFSIEFDLIEGKQLASSIRLRPAE